MGKRTYARYKKKMERIRKRHDYELVHGTPHPAQAKVQAKAKAKRNKRRGGKPKANVPGRPAAPTDDYIVNYNAYLKSFHWQQTRQRKLLEVGRKCEECGSVLELQVHHLHYRSLRCEQMADLQVLCRSCHELKHEKAIAAKRRSGSL